MMIMNKNELFEFNNNKKAHYKCKDLERERENCYDIVFLVIKFNILSISSSSRFAVLNGPEING